MVVNLMNAYTTKTHQVHFKLLLFIFIVDICQYISKVIYLMNTLNKT